MKTNPKNHQQKWYSVHIIQFCAPLLWMTDKLTLEQIQCQNAFNCYNTEQWTLILLVFSNASFQYQYKTMGGCRETCQEIDTIVNKIRQEVWMGSLHSISYSQLPYVSVLLDKKYRYISGYVWMLGSNDRYFCIHFHAISMQLGYELFICRRVHTNICWPMFN